MPVYEYKCKGCGATFTSDHHDGEILHDWIECGGQIVRNYKAEAVGVNLANLREARG